MSILTYTGVMGSGKTYEAVSTAALTALRSGRRVITNISGFNFEAIRDFIGPLKDGSSLSEDKVVVVPSLRITEPHFFFDPDSQVESAVQPGDLVLIDEVWAFWGADKKILPEHQKFFRMHRHYTEKDSGVSCDLVIMIQDLSSLHRSIKGVLESTFKFTKMKTLGLTSRYRVEVYEGHSQRKASLISVSNKKYDKRIFPLYKSYDAGVGKESVVDGRQNLLKNKWFIFVMSSAIIVIVWGGIWFAKYVSRLQSGGGTKSSTTQSAPPAVLATVPTPVAPLASDVRLVGLIQHATGETTVIFQLADNRMVRQRMDAGLLDGWQTAAGYQGRMASFNFSPKTK